MKKTGQKNKPKNIVEIMDRTEKPLLKLPKDLRRAYYEERKEKYGF